MGLFADALRTDRCVITSPLPVDDLLDRLCDAGLTGWGSYLLWYGRPLSGRVSGNRVVAIRRDIVSNLFRPFLLATIDSTRQQTHLRCEIRPLRPVAIVVMLWLTIGAVGSVVGIGAAIVGVDHWWTPLGFLGLGLLMFAIGAWMSSGDRDHLRDSIMRAVDGDRENDHRPT